MASLRNVIKDYIAEIRDGIAWVAIYKDGRSWEAKAFYPESGSYEHGFVFSNTVFEEMMSISKTDHKAICVNGQYCDVFGLNFDAGDEADRLGGFPIDKIEDKLLYFYEARLTQLHGDFLNCMVIPPKEQENERTVKQFNISYMRNSVPQTILAEASSANEAGRYFMCQEPDATFYGIHEATADDMRPGKPVMKVPVEFLKNNEAVLKQYGLDKPSDETSHYRMLDRLRSDCEYYLGNGNRYAGHLWVVDNVQGHIELMKALWNSFPADGKPEWLPYAKILDYEKQMVDVDKNKTVDELITDASGRTDAPQSRISEKDLEV